MSEMLFDQFQTLGCPAIYDTQSNVNNSAIFKSSSKTNSALESWEVTISPGVLP